jgi:hypothetical protein
MTNSIQEIQDSIACCGLICKLCKEAKSGNCPGCRIKSGGCAIKECAKEKEIEGCWRCPDYPCDERAMKNTRTKTFIQCARQEGLHKLATYLKNNEDRGIEYHKADGTTGDYDILDSETKVMELLRFHPTNSCI